MYSQKVQPRKSWLRRHRILTAIIAIPLVLVVAFFGTAVVVGIARGVHIANAQTPQQLAEAASWDGHNIAVEDDNGNIIVIRETLNLSSSASTYHNEVVEDCFALQKAFWTRYADLASIQVQVYGPDKRTGTGLFGICAMKHANAARQQWDQLNAQSGWNVYDEKVLAPAIAN
ncbi:MAG TPA: hypothetical protein VGN34_15515 [Ktedonobacteraceae bacterium]|jgi:hypothetical protein